MINLTRHIIFITPTFGADRMNKKLGYHFSLFLLMKYRRKIILLQTLQHKED